MTVETKSAEGTVAKALTLLDIVADFERAPRFNDVLERSPYPKASSYRLLQTLVNQRMLRFDDDTGRYHLGHRLVRLAHSAWKNASLAPVAASAIDRLSAKIGETVHLAHLDNGQVLYLDKRNANRPIAMFSDAGKIGPAYCTGVGKAMLAHLDDAMRERIVEQQSFYAHTENTLTSADALRAELDDIRREGISFDREEHEPNIICAAVPIISASGQVLGGISITSATTRSSLEELAAFKPDLQSAAQQIANDASDWLAP